jgi:hypothetical protein
VPVARPTMRPRPVSVLVLGLLSATGARAEGAVDAGYAIQVEGCPDEIAANLPAGVKLEIDVLLREHGTTDTRPERVAVSCDEAGAQITVAMAGASRRSTVSLDALAAEHRARAIALAAAELVHAMIGAPPPEARPPPPTVAASSAARPAADSFAPPSVGRPTLLVGALAQWLGQPAVLLLGVRGAFRYPLGEVLVPALSIDGALGNTSVSSGEVAAVALAGGLHLYAGKTTGHFRFEAGPGARGGWVHLSGRPDAGSSLEGRSLGAPWGGPELRARVAFRRTDDRFPAAAIELGAGYVALPVRGLRDGTAPVYAVEGSWLSIGAELGLGL